MFQLLGQRCVSVWGGQGGIVASAGEQQREAGGGGVHFYPLSVPGQQLLQLLL